MAQCSPLLKKHFFLVDEEFYMDGSSPGVFVKKTLHIYLSFGQNLAGKLISLGAVSLDHFKGVPFALKKGENASFQNHYLNHY